MAFGFNDFTYVELIPEITVYPGSWDFFDQHLQQNMYIVK